MADDVMVTPGGAGLSQIERVVDVFVAPSKTFKDILRSASCWMPLLLVFLFTFVWAYSIDKKVGYEAATEVQISKSSQQADMMAQLPPDQRAQRMELSAKITKYSTYASVVFAIVIMLIEALIFWGVFNFGLGASTKFSQVFAVVAYSALPRSLMWLLSAIVLAFGVGTENFDMRNPVGTNLGYYLTDSPKWLSTVGQFFDVFGLWSLAVVIIGMAIISGKTKGQSAAVVLGLWVIVLLLAAGASAAFS